MPVSKPTEESQLGASLSRLPSEKCKMFVLEYPKDHNGTAAAIRAGCTVKSAGRQAHKWLQLKTVRAIIGKVERQDVEKLEIDRHEVLRQLLYALTRDVTDFVAEDGSLLPVHEMNDRARALIDGLDIDETVDPETGEVVRRKTKLRLTSKIAAIDMGLKHKGLFAPAEIDLTASTMREFFERLQRPPELDPVEERLRLEEGKIESIDAEHEENKDE